MFSDEQKTQAAASSSVSPDAALKAIEELRAGSESNSRLIDCCSADFLVCLANMLVLSPPMLEALRSHPDWLNWLQNRLAASEGGEVGKESLDASWSRWLKENGTATAFLDLLRGFKRREYLHIVFSDLSGFASFAETVRSISTLAAWVVQKALAICWEQVTDEGPGDLKGRPTPSGFAVLALGKLGGNELNYSSDIDLIFCRRPSDAESERRFYTRLGERLIQSLSRSGPDGFLYRVDMRLRPHGETGPLVPTLPSLAGYYESWSEAWERQALIKARPVAGDADLSNRFRDFAGRFTFARQMEDSSLEEIKRVRHRAEKEHAGDVGRIDLKQGSGGIRDIEFYTQYLQLIGGWKHKRARSGTTIEAIRELADARLLLDGEESALLLAYVLFRIVEHRLQLRALTAQSVLPRDEKELGLLAAGLGYEGEQGVPEFMACLSRHRARVRSIFERIYLAPGYLSISEREEEFARLLSDRAPREQVRQLLQQYGFQDADKAWQNLRLMALGPEGRLLPPGERRSFLEFVFPLLDVLRDSIDPDRAIHHLEAFAAASGNRIAFLRALASRRSHLARLTNLLAFSMLAHMVLSRRPEFFDTLARGIHLHEGRGWLEMHREILDRLGASPRGESPGAIIRRFRQREMIRIAYRDMAALADAWEVSAELSALGEACALATLDLTRPAELNFDRLYREDMLMIGLGKLGSRMMHYASDLDLVFLYDSPASGDSAEDRAYAQRGADNRVERILELLSAVTSEGNVYDIDLRLRPEGASGLLARSWEGFEEYAGRHMQPWERLALVRSRVLRGSSQQREQWQSFLDRHVYGYAWNEEALEALRHLKRRIENEKSQESRTHLDFKYGRGGVLDLEFLVQWLQLRHGGENPAVRSPSLLEALSALRDGNAIRADEAESLLAAHLFHRQVENHYQLMEEWNSREISRESPALTRLARSLGFSGESPDEARRAFIARWESNAGLVRGRLEKHVFRP